MNSLDSTSTSGKTTCFGLDCVLLQLVVLNKVLAERGEDFIGRAVEQKRGVHTKIPDQIALTCNIFPKGDIKNG